MALAFYQATEDPRGLQFRKVNKNYFSGWAILNIFAQKIEESN